MSFNTSPTRLNEVLIDSDQTWVSRKSLKVPSGSTFFAEGQTQFGGANAATINEIASGTFNPGEIALDKHGSSVTTFSAPGATANDPLIVNDTSQVSNDLIMSRSFVSTADVGAVQYNSTSTVTQSPQDIRWTAIDLA